MADIINGNRSSHTGIAFPFTMNQGKIAMNSDEEHIRQSLTLLLRTAKGERIMRPDFGTALHDYVFAPLNSTTAMLVKKEIQDAIERFEPRISILEIEVTFKPSQPGMMFIDLQYRIQNSDNIQNLAHRFNFEGGV